jgi:hypothetical protein
MLATMLASFGVRAQSALQIPTVVTPETLSGFELQADLSAEEIYDAEQAERAEAAGEFEVLNETLMDKLVMNPLRGLGESIGLLAGRSPNVVIEIFQASRDVGQQFLVARQYGRIRYVFAVSGGGHGKSTPGGTFGVTRQNWRHMSSLYPSAGENNMDHVTFFVGGVGFHSTTMGAYRKLGQPDSHGCVRLGRPQARKIYTLIKGNGAAATIISRKSGEPDGSELGLIKKQLSKDFNFIQWMLNNKQKGDVPFTEAEYMSYLNGTMSDGEVKEKMKRYGMSKIVEVPDDQDLGPFGPALFQ